MPVRIRHLSLVRIPEIPDPDEAIGTPVSCPEVTADAVLGRPGVGVVTVVQDPLLDITEDVLHRVIVRTPLGQRRPAQVQRAHQPTRLSGFARVRRVPVEGHPHRSSGIPAPDPPQEPADKLRSLAGKERPASATVVHVVEGEQVKASPRLLVAGQNQAALPRVPPSPVSLDRDRLDVEKDQDPAGRAVLPLPAEAAEDRGPLRVIAQQFAADAPQVEAPFFSRRRRCSRLMAGTRRRRSR
jgi:hypothetical protein